MLLFSDLEAREGEVNQEKEADFVASRNLAAEVSPLSIDVTTPSKDIPYNIFPSC